MKAASTSLRLQNATESNMFESPVVVCFKLDVLSNMPGTGKITGGHQWITVAIGGRCCMVCVAAFQDKITAAIGNCRDTYLVFYLFDSALTTLFNLSEATEKFNESATAFSEPILMPGMIEKLC